MFSDHLVFGKGKEESKTIKNMNENEWSLVVWLKRIVLEAMGIFRSMFHFSICFHTLVFSKKQQKCTPV